MDRITSNWPGRGIFLHLTARMSRSNRRFHRSVTRARERVFVHRFLLLWHTRLVRLSRADTCGLPQQCIRRSSYISFTEFSAFSAAFPPVSLIVP